MRKNMGGLPLILCLTGCMASGKNEVASLLEKAGWACMDADKAAHESLEENKIQVLEAFSEEALAKSLKLVDANGKIARREMAKLVFSSAATLSRLENILYPHVEEKLNSFILANRNQNVALNATNLYKLPDLMQKCAHIFFIDSHPFIRLFRAAKRDKLSFPDILRRFKRQNLLLEKYRNFDIPLKIILNNGSRKKLEENVAAALKAL